MLKKPSIKAKKSSQCATCVTKRPAARKTAPKRTLANSRSKTR